jgi:hypothetical protein
MEREHDEHQPALIGRSLGAREDRTVALVHAVEVPDGYQGGRAAPKERMRTVDTP